VHHLPLCKESAIKRVESGHYFYKSKDSAVCGSLLYSHMLAVLVAPRAFWTE